MRFPLNPHVGVIKLDFYSTIALVSAKTSAHCVCGHAWPWGNNTYQHRRLFHSGPSQKDPSGTLKAQLSNIWVQFPGLWRLRVSLFFSVCGNRPVKQETVPSRRNGHGRKCRRGLRSLLSFRNLQHDSHLSRRSVSACVYLHECMLWSHQLVSKVTLWKLNVLMEPKVKSVLRKRWIL